MNIKFIAIPVIALAAGIGLAACGSQGAAKGAAPAATHSSAAPAVPAPDAPAPTTPAATPANTLACSTVIDETGWSNGPLTAERAIAAVSAVFVTDGVNLQTGNPSNTDLNLLDSQAMALENYSGSQLADDANKFKNDENSYNPGQTDFGPADTAYATQMNGDILKLVADCPGSAALRDQMLHG
jgi:hypothetical protein